RCDRVDDDDVDGPGADQHLADLERLLPGIGLRDEQILGADPELARVADVEGVLRVDEGGDAARLLRLGDDVEGERRLARRFRPVDFDDAAARDAADAKREIERDAPGGDGGDVLEGGFACAEPHHRSLAELLLDGRDGQLDRLLLLRICQLALLARRQTSRAGYCTLVQNPADRRKGFAEPEEGLAPPSDSLRYGLAERAGLAPHGARLFPFLNPLPDQRRDAGAERSGGVLPAKL